MLHYNLNIMIPAIIYLENESRFLKKSCHDHIAVDVFYNHNNYLKTLLANFANNLDPDQD